MKKKNLLTLDDEFIQYCKLNNIEDVEKYAKEVFNKGFTMIKYGDAPTFKPTTSLKEETVKKWETTGVLDNLEPMEKKEEEKIQKILEPIVKKEKDIYDE